MTTEVRVAGRSPATADGVVPGKIGVAGLVAVVGSVAANLLARPLLMAATGLTEQFLPLNIGPIATFTVIGVALGVGVFALLVRFTRRPLRLFTIIALVALAVSCLPNVLAALNPSAMPMPGASAAGFLALIVFHIIPAVVTIAALTRLTRG
jgi:hypothetical protein